MDGVIFISGLLALTALTVSTQILAAFRELERDRRHFTPKG